MFEDPMLGRIRKLLAKAEDPACTADEAELFTAKAAELIAKYGIDRALLAVEDPDTDRVGDRVIPLDAPYALDKAALLHVVATELRWQTVQRSRYVTNTRLGGHRRDRLLLGHRGDQEDAGRVLGAAAGPGGAGPGGGHHRSRRDATAVA